MRAYSVSSRTKSSNRESRTEYTFWRSAGSIMKEANVRDGHEGSTSPRSIAPQSILERDGFNPGPRLDPGLDAETKRFWPGGRRTFHHGFPAAGSRQSARWPPREGCVVREAPACRGYGPHGEGSRRAAARLSAVRWQYVPSNPAKSMGGAKGRGRGCNRVGALWSRPLWGAHPRLRFLDGREPARARTSPHLVAGKRASVSSRRADQGRGSETRRRSPLDRVQESGSGLPRLLAGERPYGRFPRPWSSLSASTG